MTQPSSDGPTIFVSIAAYRDPEIYFTVRDLFTKAKRPQNLHVAICWQYDVVNDKPLDFEEFRDRVTIINMSYHKSSGVCWTRHLLRQLYRDENYFMQIDSHFRFIQDWDEETIREFNLLPVQKAVLSGYPSQYKLPNALQNDGTHKQAFGSTVEGIPNVILVAMTEQEKSSFARSPLINAGFIFARGEAVHEVPIDPMVYIPGEEVSLAVRFWTHGYDMFVSGKTLNYHLYWGDDPNKVRYWQDNRDWDCVLQRRSFKRLRHLFGIEHSDDSWALQDLGHYGLGTVRTLAEYEAVAGISFRDGYYSESAKQGIFNI